MGIFEDRPYEDIGTRQKRWLDYLQYHNDLKSFKVCSEFEHRKYSPRNLIEECICPIDHREILPFEIVVEFDGNFPQINLAKIRTILNILPSVDFTFYVADHYGRSPHLHIFSKNNKEAIQAYLSDPILFDKMDFIKLGGAGLIRCIGGRYYGEDITYKSWIASNELISRKPIRIQKEVRFPCNFEIH